MSSYNYTHLRNQDIPSWTAEDEEDPYALIFVVNDTKDGEGNLPPEEDIIQAAAKALTLLLLDDDELVRVAVMTWMSGRIRKITKRAKNAAWDKTAFTALPFAEAEHNNAKVRAFTPVKLSEQPAELKKLQVSGLQAVNSEENNGSSSSYLEVFIDESLQMTTGKLIAQVGHAVQLFIMQAADEKVQAWLHDDQVVRITRVADMPEAGTMDAVVHDAGLTEVPAGSLTVAAVYRG